MNIASAPIQPASVLIDGKSVNDNSGVRFDYRTFEILLIGYQRISIYGFNSLMLSGRTARQAIDQFVFDGPKLGLYYDVMDVREGPYINHLVKHLEISVTYPSEDEARINMSGRADLSESSFDPCWYKGPTSGEWIFEVSCVHRYPNHDR